ncbi:hypothetical protein XFF6166_630007 [Xanthomonas citri pv. fuscans]|nr:hypothetical protein XFF6166_630007 [Xanthomonas citri pv. fuscans]SOO04138.1 hypothetical protein XFF6960_940002 [Xanthomonas citri pv. fuscans]SOO07177.1 hypothetical protein XFF7767_910003 [Xanthomonas citri pv. fuscans]
MPDSIAFSKLMTDRDPDRPHRSYELTLMRRQGMTTHARPSHWQVFVLRIRGGARSATGRSFPNTPKPLRLRAANLMSTDR